jgi:hypothetical protein
VIDDAVRLRLLGVHDEATIRSSGCLVWLARIWLSRSLVRRISFAWIAMSEAWPCVPPQGWWIRMREFGSAKRLSGVPAASSTAPMEAAWPTQIV